MCSAMPSLLGRREENQAEHVALPASPTAGPAMPRHRGVAGFTQHDVLFIACRSVHCIGQSRGMGMMQCSRRRRTFREPCSTASKVPRRVLKTLRVAGVQARTLLILSLFCTVLL